MRSFTFPAFFFCALLALHCEGTSGPLLRGPSSEQGGASSASGGDGAVTGGTMGEEPWSVPDADSSFQIQLSDGVDTNVEAELFIVDVHSPEDSDFDALKERGAYVACYFSAGSFEPWRPDDGDFPEAVKGSPVPDYESEQWLNVADQRVVDLMVARMETAQARGCDAVYPSLIRPDPGAADFSLTASDFEVYARTLTDEAHSLGLAAFYAASLYDPLALDFDVALILRCVETDTCGDWATFPGPRFSVEYGDTSDPSACPTTDAPAWPVIIKSDGLDAARTVCP